MAGPHTVQAVAEDACCLKPMGMADAPAIQPAGFGQIPAAPDVHPEYLQTPLAMAGIHQELSRQACLSGLGVGQSGSPAQSAGSFSDALVPYTTQQRSPMGHSNPQLQPLLALLNAAQQAKQSLLIRASSCEVPAGSGRKLPHKRTPNVLYKVSTASFAPSMTAWIQYNSRIRP